MAKILRFPPLAIDLGDHVRVAKEGHTPYEATVTIPPDYFGNVYLLVDQKFLEGPDDDGVRKVNIREVDLI